MATVARIRLAHFIEPNIEYRIMKMTSNVSGMIERKPLLGPLLARVFAGPIDVVAGRQLHLLVDLRDRLFDRAAQGRVRARRT